VAFAPVAAQSGAPVVAVIGFENGTFGPAAKDYDGIGKGIMDLVITDLASTSKVRVVERARIQAILDEQSLAKSGAVDASTAVRVGRIFSACYSVVGGFTRNDKTGENTLTLRTYNNETSQITNPIKVESKGDDMMQLIAKATAQFIKDMNVTACPGTAGAPRSGDAPAAQQQSSAPAQVQAPATAATAKPAAPVHVEYAKVLKPDEIKKVQSTKLDARTMLIYSRALDAKDRKDNARAKQLAEQVLTKYKDFSPARDLIAAASAGN
jgi:hypothetical protein